MGRSRSAAVRTVIVVTAVEMLLATTIRIWSALELGGVELGWPSRLLAASALLWLPVQGWALAWLIRDFQDARAARADTERRLHSLAMTTHDWLWSMDRAGMFTYASPGCRELFGYEPEELVGQSVRKIMHPNASAQSLAECAQAVQDGTAWSDLVLHCIDKAGHDRYVLSSAVPVIDHDGTVIGHNGATRLLTDDGYQRVYGIEVGRRIRQVMSTDGLSVALQPIVRVLTDSVSGVEALARFSADPPQSPDRWFADAESVGMGRSLELFAVGKALDLLDVLPSWLYLSINASPKTISTPELHALLTNIGADAQRVVIEITEHESIDDYEAMTRARDQLRTLGVRLAVDDAGAGFASFRHILRLQPDIIKLDRCLISGIDADRARRALAASMVVFSLEVGATVVAEGVETADELSAVLDLGIDAVQGYHIGRPSLHRDDWDRWSRPQLHLVATSGRADIA